MKREKKYEVRVLSCCCHICQIALTSDTENYPKWAKNWGKNDFFRFFQNFLKWWDNRLSMFISAFTCNKQSYCLFREPGSSIFKGDFGKKRWFYMWLQKLVAPEVSILSTYDKYEKCSRWCELFKKRKFR